MVAKFHIIVRGRCRSAAEFVRRELEHIRQRLFCRAGVVLQDAGFVKNHAGECRCVKVANTIIVCCVDAGCRHCTHIWRVGRMYVELLTLTDCLMCNAEWCYHQDALSGVSANLICKLKLHRRFSKAALCKNSGFPFFERPPNNVMLIFVEFRVQVIHFKSRIGRNVLF